MTVPQHDVDYDSRWHDAAWRTRFRRSLLKWFDRDARDLPWRGTNDPYRVWISEIMLQQTQVATVIPYYERFMKRFDTVARLAEADEQEVLRHWEGLGYYRRARQMHAAAGKIMADHDGIFPTNFDDVLALPGIGRYTAGAILSISLDQQHPVVEANTLRLYSRLMALRAPTNKPAGQQLLWEFAAAILPRRGSGKLNQAAMELGSLVCKPREPACLLCPLLSLCAAHALGLQASIPGKVKQIQYETRRELAIVVRDKQHILLRQCLPDERWAGLWDFPRCEVGDEEDAFAIAEQWLRDRFGITIRNPTPLTTIKHGVTKYRITLEVIECEAVDNGKTSLPDHARWLKIDEVEQQPLSTTGRKIFHKLS